LVKDETDMKSFASSAAAAACFFFGMGAAASGSEPLAAVPDGAQPAVQSASVCIKDLTAFSNAMQKGGYWLGESGDGYGYPMGGMGYGYPQPVAGHGPMTVQYDQARPGYEIRVLLASAGILAQARQQQPCEQVLATAQSIYKRYAGKLHDRGLRPGDQSIWQRSEIAAAVPVTARDVPYRSDQLIDSDVRNANDNSLGSVHDLIMNPDTGKIAYVVLARGGVFGIGTSYVPVPWDDFKSAPRMHFLVLDSKGSVLAAAPKFRDSEFKAFADFDQKSKQVDAYWVTHLTDKGTD
jgi:sporulation protein YlmC with PRC-barrel domain